MENKSFFEVMKEEHNKIMNKKYLEENKIYCMNCLEGLQEMRDNSINLVITSPPYDNLRKYNGYSFDFENIVKELYKKIKNGGVVVWVVNDATIDGSETGTSFKQALFFMEVGFKLHDTMIYSCNKPPMTHNRYEQGFEYMFVFVKGKLETFNPIMKPNKYVGNNCIRNGDWASGKDNSAMRQRDGKKKIKGYSIKNNVWYYETGGNKSTKDKIAFKHPAIFPEKLAEDHILSWTNEGDLVVDIFNGCFDKETEVLTQYGWKLFENLKKDDMIYSLNPETKEIEIINYVKYIKYKFNGEMYRINGRSVDLLITPNHKIYAKEYHHLDYKLYTMEDFKFKTFHKYNQGNWSYGEDYNNDLLEFIGFFIGDGWKIERNKNNRLYRIGFNLLKKRKIKYFKELCNKLSINYNEYDYGDRKTFHIHNKKLYEMVEGNSYTKRIPKFIFNLNRKCINSFLKGFYNADGSGKCYYSVNKNLIDDLQVLLLLSGRSGIVVNRDRSKNDFFIKGRKINSNNIQYELHFHKENKKLILRSHNISKEKYNDYVYDVTLEKNHILYVRRNGKPCWSGNSGTTTKMAYINNRRYIGFELSEEYCDIAQQRLNKELKQKKLPF